MNNLRAISRPQNLFSCCSLVGRRVSGSIRKKNPDNIPGFSSTPAVSLFSALQSSSRNVKSSTGRWRLNQQYRRMVAMAVSSNWGGSKSPYETLELDRTADEEQIKIAYRRLAKFYHPDVYDARRGSLEEGETAESRFIKIQAAYELLIDEDKRKQYDFDNRVNPMKASEAWIMWIMKKKKAFDQRGDMAVAAWAEQQQRELNLRARGLTRSKIDPEEERKILVKEKKTSLENVNTTLKRHTLVLKKRDLMRRKAEQDQKKIISELLAAEGLELEQEQDQDQDKSQ